MRVTGSHLLADGRRVEEIPEAQKIESVAQLACLDTSDHTIPINDILFEDFGWAEWIEKHDVFRLGEAVVGIIVGFRFSEGTGWEVLAVDM